MAEQPALKSLEPSRKWAWKVPRTSNLTTNKEKSFFAVIRPIESHTNHLFGQSQECEKDYKCRDKPAGSPANWGRACWKAVPHKQVCRCNSSQRTMTENVGSPLGGARWQRTGDKGHWVVHVSHSFLCFGLYCQDLPSILLGTWDPYLRKSGIRITSLGRGGPGKGTFKQIRHTEVHGTWQDAPESADGVGYCHCGAIFSYLCKVSMFRGSSPVSEKEQEDPSQFYLKPWDEDRANKPGKHLQTHEKEEGG